MSIRTTRRAEVRRKRALRPITWAPNIDAARREIRRTRRRRYRKHRQNVFLFILVISLLAGGLIYHFGFDLVTMRGSGMRPTLSGGDMVLCVKQSMLDWLRGIVPEEYRQFGLNDVVLIRYEIKSEDEEEPGREVMLIKRIIAMDGDEVDAGGGELIRNRDTLIGEMGDSDLVYPVRVPASHMFLTGDDRAVSIDSRMRSFGMIPEADVVGRPLFVVWPLYAAGPVS